MKKYISILTIILIIVGIAKCQEKSLNFTVKVIDDAGTPIANCIVGTQTIKGGVPTPAGLQVFPDEQQAATDANGLVEFKMGSYDGVLNLNITPDNTPKGHYWTSAPNIYYEESNLTHWLPKDKQHTIVLKRKLNPIEMIYKGVMSKIPALDKNFGYDLVVGDWVAPYGKGKVSDLNCELKVNLADSINYKKEFTVNFNNKGDGLVLFEVPLHKGSKLISNHLAPQAGYQANIVKTIEKVNGKIITNTSFNENANYYFRIRTVYNEQGKIESALYGKIYGDLYFSGWDLDSTVRFIYYLNPNNNDPNVESAPKGINPTTGKTIRINKP